MFYTVEMDNKRQSFEGFKQATRPLDPGDKYSLAVATDLFDGTREYWYLDAENPIALSEHQRYYRMDGFPQMQIQVWPTYNPSVDCDV